MTDSTVPTSSRVGVPSAPTAPTLVAASLAALLAVSQFYVVIPMFDRLADDWTADIDSVTWTQTVFGLAYSAGFLLWGWATDRYGPRRVMVLGLSITVVTTALVPLATTIETGLALRAVQGLTTAAFAPAAFTYLGTRITPRHRPLALTVLTSSFFAASVVGQVGAQALLGEDGWRRVFIVSSIAFAIMAALLAWTVLPDEPQEHPAAPVWTAMLAMVRRRPIPLLLPAVLTIMGSFVAVYTAVELSGVLADPDDLLWLRAGSLPAMVLVPFVAPLFARLAPTTRLATSLAVAAALTAVLAIPAAQTLLGYGLVLFALVLAIGTAAPSAVEAIMAHHGGAPGAATSLYVFTLFVGASLGSQASAAVGGGLSATALVATALLAMGVLLTLAAARQTRQ